ncbi:hypothetical protein [Candidatus Uabimicrobium sp. HlEnr_7]|uniref:hypothetical protein n=1 Tax=Candidatus Uabimicrobium helgolandensis TaxID=3095367 RepID=UPI003556049D
MDDNDWDPSQPPSSDLGSTLALAAVFIGGAAITAAFVDVPALRSTTMGSTTSAKIQWQQNEAQVRAAIEEQEKAFNKSQDECHD